MLISEYVNRELRGHELTKTLYWLWMPGQQGQYFAHFSVSRAVVLETWFYWRKKKKNMCRLNAGATSKYNSVKTHAPAILGCIIDINKLCSCWSYHLGSFIMQTKILALMANCEMFVNPEWLNHGILLKCAVLFSSSATCGLPEFSTPDTFHHGMLRFLLRGARWVRILWHFAYICTPRCRHNVPFVFGGAG